MACLPVIGGAACATPHPKDETVVLVDPAPLDAVPATTSAPASAPAILTERLDPVRGGARVLPPYRGPDPCKMALLGDSPVAKACSDGGLRAAAELMQLFVKRARAEGIIFVCTDCHSDEDDFSKLTSQADAEFRKLLFLARPAD